MRTIVVDSDFEALKRFERLSAGIPEIQIVGQFECALDALIYAQSKPVELVFFDPAMSTKEDWIIFVKQLRKIRADILVVFVSECVEYIKDFNRIGGDYYLTKPYSRGMLETAMERIRLIAHRLCKRLYIRTFGNFIVTKDGNPLPLDGKAKEILALLVTCRGKEMSNREIYNTLWEGREYSNDKMSVFYNALGRLRKALREQGCERLLISAARGQMINTELFDCDYYEWQDKGRNYVKGEFLPEYAWSKNIFEADYPQSLSAGKLNYVEQI